MDETINLRVDCSPEIWRDTTAFDCPECGINHYDPAHDVSDCSLAEVVIDAKRRQAEALAQYLDGVIRRLLK